MAEVLKVLTNIRSLRVLARNESLELLESILENLKLNIFIIKFYNDLYYK